MRKTIRALLVDDEAPARSELAYLLQSQSDIDVVAEAENGKEAVSLARKVRPDLLFLDIQMPVKNGFHVVQELLADEEIPYFVFVTAYDRYAVKAFELHAFDYLLKPIDPARLASCLEKLRKTLARDRAYRESLENLVEMMGGSQRPGAYSAQLAVRRGQRIYPMPVEEIRYVKVEGGVVEVGTTEGLKMTNFNSLEEVEEVLDPALFFRVHRSYLVNLRSIQEILPLSHQTFKLKMKGIEEYEIPLSRIQAKKLRKMLRF